MDKQIYSADMHWDEKEQQYVFKSEWVESERKMSRGSAKAITAERKFLNALEDIAWEVQVRWVKAQVKEYKKAMYDRCEGGENDLDNFIDWVE